jgi:hypothetical protein
MAERKRLLIRGLKLWFDLVLLLGTVGLAVVMVLGIATSFEEEDQSDWTVSVPIALGEGQLKPVLSLTSETGEDPVATEKRIVDGRGELRFDTLDNVLYLGSIFYHCLAGFIALCVVYLLRRILSSTLKGEPFSRANVRDLMLIGWIMVAAGAIGPFLERLFVGWVLPQVEAAVIAIPPPPLGLRVETIITGLLVLVLASVLREAAAMAEEQSLTV